MEKNGYTATIKQDEFGDDPRQEWDNFGTMVCLHGRYNLGDINDISLEEAQELESDKDHIVLPIYMYDHSGLTVSTTPFSCQWDSGKLGFIYVSKKKVREEFGQHRITAKLRAKVLEYLKGEVEVYDQYLQGEVYGVVIEKDEEEVESTWGILGYDNAEEIAKELLDYSALVV